MKVRLQPLDETIECGPQETVLDAAFRQGYNLAHGCREGQCSACKCFLLEGDVELRRHSSFALSESERSSGYALMCRALPESDLVVELLHFDPDDYRLEHAIGDHEAAVESVVELTHDIVGLTLRAELEFIPGQYIEVHVPGDERARRSFSIANLPGEGRLELIIKRYPGGRFSSLLHTTRPPPARLRFTGPYGSFRLRQSERPILMVAGGSGMAPILALLRQLARDGCERPVRFYYGARSDRDLFSRPLIASLGERLADFRFVPVTGGFVHESIDDELDQPDIYMCGPPPMLDATEAMLLARGADPQRIFQDRFTTSADAPPQREPTDEREFAWFAPAGRRATLYEDVTVDTQPSIHRHLTRGWPLHFEDGRGTWDDSSTALRCEDWYAFRDPGQLWERPFYSDGAALERQIELAVGQGPFDQIDPDWVHLLVDQLQVAAFVEHGLWFALATAARDCLSDTVATCVCLQAANKQRSAQAIVLYAMDLERALGRELSVSRARERFLADARWQPTRRYLERLAATRDWGEVIVATNLCFEPTVGALLRRELGIRGAAGAGDTVTPVLARAATAEWQWAREWTVALVSMLASDNRELIECWVGDWLPDAIAAALALGGAGSSTEADELLARGLLAEVDGAASRVSGGSSRPATAVAEAPGEDYVGIVMAKSAEGDAVAGLLGVRPGIEVIEQPAFWEIRARDRLSIDFQELSDRLGYEIGAYSIQREMSTHYGRMVATDDALMLFSDPAEAMEHLLS